MAKSPAFVLSKATELKLDDNTLSIEHAGDVLIEQTLGRDLGVVRSGGDLTVRLERVTGTLIAAGTLRVEGDVDGAKLQAARIVLESSKITCKVISASERVEIGASDLKVDAILAPTILLDPNTRGRVKVIQSDNERSASKIKGGFSLADYEDMFGDSEAFLVSLGLETVPESSHSPTPPVSEQSGPPALLDDDELAGVELTSTAPAVEDGDEEIDDPLSLSLDDLEPINDGISESDEIQARLLDAMDRITACYEGNDLPPAVSELRSLIGDGDRKALSMNITSVWNGLLGFHQKRGIRPHHQVTHAFNVIHSLVG